MTEDYKKLNSILKRKNVIYIPIISCINRDTNEYDLGADGNVNRFITAFSLCDSYKKLAILLPKKHVEGSEKIIEEFAKYHNVELVWCDDFGKHAKDQRVNEDIIRQMIQVIDHLDHSHEYDLCIFESQGLGSQLVKSHSFDTIWWNPVSATDTKSRDFLEGYEEMNKEVINISDWVLLASPDQVKYYSGYKDKVLLIDRLIDRDLKYFDYKPDRDIIVNHVDLRPKYFLPYRLTDQGYKFDKVLEYLESDKSNWIALYTDPNNSHVIENLEPELKDRFIKVSSKRDTYYTILDYAHVTIPYFEDLEFINHASIWEFMHDKTNCKVILQGPPNDPYGIYKSDKVEFI